MRNVIQWIVITILVLAACLVSIAGTFLLYLYFLDFGHRATRIFLPIFAVCGFLGVAMWRNRKMGYAVVGIALLACFLVLPLPPESAAPYISLLGGLVGFVLVVGLTRQFVGRTKEHIQSNKPWDATR